MYCCDKQPHSRFRVPLSVVVRFYTYAAAREMCAVESALSCEVNICVSCANFSSVTTWQTVLGSHDVYQISQQIGVNEYCDWNILEEWNWLYGWCYQAVKKVVILLKFCPSAKMASRARSVKRLKRPQPAVYGGIGSSYEDKDNDFVW